MNYKHANCGLEEGFRLAAGSTYLRVDLDVIDQNLHILHTKCFPHTELIVVIKGNAYGHGAVSLARHLNDQGRRHFAVATVSEGRELRQAGVVGFIQILGNNVREGINTMREYDLTPTVSTLDFLKDWSDQMQTRSAPPVVIKVDSGMSRNGCQPDHLPALVKMCSDLGIPVHSIMTHFAQAWDDDSFTRNQLSTFLSAVKPYRQNGVKVHAANSAAIIRGFATDLDFVRPGICVYGLPPDSSEKTQQVIHKAGLRPALCWIAHPTLLKHLNLGRHVGYDRTYTVNHDQETIATFAVGYADGYNRQLSDKGILLTMDGQQHHVVGRVSMDAITVRVTSQTSLSTPFYIASNDVTAANSVAAIAATLGTIPYEVATSLATRLPRLFYHGNRYISVDENKIDGVGVNSCCNGDETGCDTNVSLQTKDAKMCRTNENS